MNAYLNHSKNLEFLFLIIGLSIFFGILVFKFIDLSPFILISISLSLLVAYLATYVKGSFYLFYLLLGITFLDNKEGINLVEIPFYVFSAILALVIFLKFINGDLIIDTFLDKLFLFLTALIPYGIMVGLLFGNPVLTIFGESASLFGLLLYFPLRQHLRSKQFQSYVIAITIIILVFVLIRNVLNYREIIAAAVLPWEATNARIATNELILLIGTVLTFCLVITTKKFLIQIIYLFLFSAFVGGLVLTQSRGYWLAFILGAVIIFLTIDRKSKIKVLIYLFSLLGLVSIIISLYFSDLFMFVLNALLARFESIGSGKLDISLYERFLESQTVLSLILDNPISGYGFGHFYTKKILFYANFIETSYVHNGYLAVWFKFGILGLLAFLTLWFSTIMYSIRFYKISASQFEKAILLTIIGTVCGILLVNNTSNQVEIFESVLFLTLFAAFLSLKLNESHK